MPGAASDSRKKTRKALPGHPARRGIEMRTRSRTALLLATTSLTALLAACTPRTDPLGFIGGLSGRVAISANRRATASSWRSNRPMPRAVSTAAASKCWSRMTHRIRPRHGGPPRRFAAAGVTAIIGPVTSAAGEPVLTAATAAGITRRQPDGHHPALTGKDDLFLRVTGGSPAAIPILPRTTTSEDRPAARGDRFSIPATAPIPKTGYRVSPLVPLGSAARSLQKSCLSPATCRIIRRWFASCLPGKPDGLVFVSKRDRRRALCPGSPRCGRPANADRGRNGRHRAFHRTWRQGRRRCSPDAVLRPAERRTQFQSMRQAYEARFKAPRLRLGRRLTTQPAPCCRHWLRRAAERSSRPCWRKAPSRVPQQPVQFDHFGDARRQVFITVIRDGQFVVE